MLFDPVPTAEETFAAKSETAITAGFVFDWDNGCYLMEAGSPVEVTGVEAVKEWLQQVIRTRRGRYAIYPADYGCMAQKLMGRKLPKGLDLSEFRRELAESAAYCPAIREISSMTYDGKTISCTVTLETETGVTQEVIDVEP